MGQGKAAGLEIQGETLENICGQWWYLGEVSLAMAMMSHSPASGVSGAILTLHGLKEEVDPAIHHPHLFVGTDIELPRLDSEYPHSQEVKLGRMEGLGLLPLLLGLALEEQGSGTPARGGQVLWYPCKPCCSSCLKSCGHTARAPQLAAELEAAILSSAVGHNALSCLLDSALLKGCAEPWQEQKELRLCHSCHPRGKLWPVRRGCGQMGPRTFQILFLEHMSWLTPTELLWQQQQGGLHSYRAAGPHALGSQGRSKMRCKKSVEQSQTSRAAPQQGVTGLALVTPGCSCCLLGCV